MPGPLSVTVSITGCSSPAPRGTSCGAGRPVCTTTRASLPPACTALSTRLETTRCSRSSSPSKGVAPPASSITASATQSGCSRTRRIAAPATVWRSSGRHSVARTREKSRNSDKRRDSRSLSRTTRDVRNRSSALARLARPSCSTDDRIDASGFLISCARLADSSATASSRSARKCSSSSRFESEMSVKIAVTRGSVAGSTSSVVVVTPIGNVRSARRTVASTRMARTPRRAVAVIAAQNSGATFANSGMIGRPRHRRSLKPRICSAAGLQ